MPFTVKQFLMRVNLSPDKLRRHQFKLGKSIKSSWWNRHQTNVPRVSEDGFNVCQYPDSFFKVAKKIARRYIVRHKLQVKERRRRSA